jgi:hypothetical protein
MERFLMLKQVVYFVTTDLGMVSAQLLMYCEQKVLYHK